MRLPACAPVRIPAPARGTGSATDPPRGPDRRSGHVRMPGRRTSRGSSRPLSSSRASAKDTPGTSPAGVCATRSTPTSSTVPYPRWACAALAEGVSAGASAGAPVGDASPCRRRSRGSSRARTRCPGSYLSSGLQPILRALDQEPEDRPDQLTLEGPDRLPPGLPVGLHPAGDIGLGRRMEAGLGHRDDVERPVELAVAAAVEAHPLDLPGAGRDRRHAGQGREGVGRAEAADVTDLGDEPGDGDRSRARAARGGGDRRRARRSDA